MTEGRKNDEGKNRLDLIPPEAIEALGRILTAGAIKYDARNWEKGMRWGRPYAALQRHLWVWWGGEDTDPETGESHLAHALCNVVFLLAYEARGVGFDDRPASDGGVAPVTVHEDEASRDARLRQLVEDARRWGSCDDGHA